MTDILDRLKLWKCKPPKPPCKGDALDYCECKDIDDAIAEIENLRCDVDFFMFLLGLTDNDPAKPDDTDGHPEGAS